MCRLFALLSPEPLSPLAALLDSPGSLLVKSHFDAHHLQEDGWGLGWFEGEKPKVYKQPGALFNHTDAARMVAEGIRSNVLLGHVRAASNPNHRPKSDILGWVHTQPFQHDEWLFVHNGTLWIPDEVKLQLGQWEPYVQGRNDSEVLFYWLLKTLIYESSRTSFSTRLKDSLQRLDQIWNSCKDKHPGVNGPYTGLNWVLTNGRMALAFCYVSPQGFGDAKSFYSSDKPWFQLHLMDAPYFAIASEPWDSAAGWLPLPHGELVEAHLENDGVRYERHSLRRIFELT